MPTWREDPKPVGDAKDPWLPHLTLSPGQGLVG